MSSNSLKIAVIGTGLAGLSAARALSERGHDVHCFDKGRGVGGRMSVRRADGFEFDHGAQYFTARDARFVACVDQWKQAGVVAEWPATVITLENGRPSPREFENRYVGVPGMTAIAKQIGIGLNIATSTQIVSIENEPEGKAIGWRLNSLDGQSRGPFDGLVLSIPVVQARALLAHEPALLQQISKAQMEPCWAVMAGFNARIETDFDAAFVKGSRLSWIARNNSKPGRSDQEAWVFHASAEWSTNNLEQTSEFVAQALLDEFCSLCKTLQRPTYLQAHRWRYARACVPLSDRVIAGGSGGIFVCGDWCGGSRVEDAWLSGLAAAEHLLHHNG